MDMIKLPSAVETDLLPEDVLDVLKNEGVVNLRLDTHFLIDKYPLASYYSIKGEDHFCGLDARKLVIIGCAAYILYGFVYLRKLDRSRYAQWEEYICIDINNGGQLIIIRSASNDLLFVNKSVSQFNACMYLCEKVGAELYDKYDEKYIYQVIQGHISTALRDLDPDIVGETRLYECEAGKFWNESIKTYLDD